MSRAVATAVAVRERRSLARRSATRPGLAAALLAADAIYFPDPALATAGIHFAKVMRDARRLGPRRRAG